MHTPLLAGGFSMENVRPQPLSPAIRIIFHQPYARCFLENQVHKEASMFQRLYEVHEVTQETKALATARKIAAIVASLVLPTIARSELAYSALPDALEAKLVGYLQGFCLPICAAWQVDDADVSLAATGLIVTLMFPDSPASLSASIDGLIAGSEAFRIGVDAGRRDGELYRTTGRKGTALLQILANDFQGFCDYSKVAADAPA
jgi:hypothetical protein